MQQISMLGITTPFFQLEEAKEAEQFGTSSNASVYCWKTIGRSNWLEKGFSVSDVLGLVVLPKGMPEYIDLPDDPIQS